MEFEADGWPKEFTNSLQLDGRRRRPSMESEMVQNSTSYFAVTFKMITSLKSTSVISFNLRNLINFNKIKNSITINKKKLTGFNSLPSQSSSKSDHIQEGRESLSTNPMILYKGCSVVLD